ncbi:MAG TPA: hypothetical protein VH138_15095 [Vicinamibacterales bacterium]|jgi:hypothetical protein|nr:hypothetical protein [Vicinamibacterales bacterium]
MTRRITLAAAVLLTAASAAAQGNSAGHGNAHQGGATAGASAGATPLPGSGTGSRTFGVWLDDASVAAPGGGWATLSIGYYRTDLFNEVDVPVADAGLGLTRRVQAGFSVPVYNVTPVGGSTSLQGVGDVYLHGKIQLRDPEWSLDGVGYAIVPIVEITREPVAGESKVNWALPLAIEMRFARWRWYGSGGYFSRGSLFGSVAIERPVTSRLSVTGAFSDSFATRMLPDEPANLPRSRADVSGGASYAMGPSWIVFGSIGRTISSHEATSTNVAISGGVSLNLAAPKKVR